jgi:hypothetical protein
VAALILSLALAWASWRYVEAPFRKRGPQARFTPRALVAIFAPATVAALALGLTGFLTDGFYEHYTKTRMSPQELALYRLVTDDIDYDFDAAMVDNGDCHFWQQTFTPEFEARFESCAAKYGRAVLLIGDSHAMNLHNILSKSDLYPFVASVAWHRCRPVSDHEGCPYDDARAFVERHAAQIAALMFHQSGSYLVEDSAGRVDSDASFTAWARNSLREGDVETVLAYLDSMSDKVKTLWIGPFVEARTGIRYTGGPPPAFTLNPASQPLFDKLDSDLARLTAEKAPKVGYVSLVQAFGITPDFVRQGDCVTYRDTDHFSRCGEDILAHRLAAQAAKWQALLPPAP